MKQEIEKQVKSNESLIQNFYYIALVTGINDAQREASGVWEDDLPRTIDGREYSETRRQLIERGLVSEGGFAEFENAFKNMGRRDYYSARESANRR